MIRLLWVLILCAILSGGQSQPNAAVVDSFELVWKTLRDYYWDPTMAGLNWQQLHDAYLPKIKACRNVDEARALMNEMIHNLPSSHLGLIPGEMYGRGGESGSSPVFKKVHGGTASIGVALALIDSKIVVESVESGSAAAEAGVHTGWIVESVDGDSVDRPVQLYGNVPPSLVPRIVEQFLTGPIGSMPEVVFVNGDGKRIKLAIPRRHPAGKLVQYGNIPPMRVVAEHRMLDSHVGYLRLNIFFDPVSVMPEIEKAIGDFREARGIVFDLRGNPGGLANLGLGIAGWFVADDDAVLGTMIRRTSKVPYQVNPRLEPYMGKLAILVNSNSASTSEFLAQGLKDLGRARIFGTRTAGAALPSSIIELPDGDKFQYPEANYTSLKGTVLEGNGVQPDQVVMPTIAALLEGHDMPLDAAVNWILAK